MRECLAAFGYTPREARFLQLSALLSGYFLRRQFNSFIGRNSGALAQNFLKRGLELKHFRSITALGGRLIYHVASSSIYDALGDATSRNRREHQFETVRLRLMALDFALLTPEAEWLLTEREKIDCFATLGVPQTDLPQGEFGNCKRFFVEKQPVFLDTERRPHFAFVDAAFRGFSQWELFLKAHRRLFQALSHSDVIFASCHQGRVRAAENHFRRAVAGESAAGGFDVERLRRYFVSRQAFEAKRLDSFDQSKLNALREDKRVFVGEDVERLYRQWCESGNILSAGVKGCTAGFKTELLPHSYEWLSPIQSHERRA